MTGVEVVRQAKGRLVQLAGLRPDTLSGMGRDEEGWHIAVDMLMELELRHDLGKVSEEEYLETEEALQERLRTIRESGAADRIDNTQEPDPQPLCPNGILT